MVGTHAPLIHCGVLCKELVQQICFVLRLSLTACTHCLLCSLQFSSSAGLLCFRALRTKGLSLQFQEMMVNSTLETVWILFVSTALPCSTKEYFCVAEQKVNEARGQRKYGLEE